MPKVICTRPNASTEINGVKFTVLEDGSGVISEEISAEAAELFLSIPGYHAEGDAPGGEGGEKQPEAPAAPVEPPKQPAKAPAAKHPAKAKAAPAPAPVVEPPAQEPVPEGDTPAAPAGDDDTVF